MPPGWPGAICGCAGRKNRIAKSTRIVPSTRSKPTAVLCVRDLTDVRYPKAERIRVVPDNLSMHSAGALYQAFPACNARRLLAQPEFHYAPKHAGWSNMVEIEIGVLRAQCLNRRIGACQRLESEILARERQRNAARSRFSKPARPPLCKLY
jgi:hypothetical protein